MNYWRLERVLALTVAIAGAVVVAIAAHAAEPLTLERGTNKFYLFDVSIRPIPTEPGDRIERFDCDVRGSVERINIPYEWKVLVDNPTGDNTKVKAEADVGAASFEDLSYFDRFLRIGTMTIPGGKPKFYMTVTLWISNEDKERRVKLTTKDLVLTPVSK